MSHQRALAAQRANRALGGTKPCIAAGRGGDCPALPHAGAASPRVLWAALGTAGHWGYKGTGECPEGGHGVGEGFRGETVRGAAGVPGFVQLEQRGPRAALMASAAPSQGQEEGQGWSLLSGDQRQDQ